MHVFENDECRHLAKPSIPQFVVSCALMVWLLISYIPQWARIIARKSAEGLSTYYILLGSLSGICAVGNIMVLPSSQVDMGCCRENTRFACISGLLGILQVISGIACFWAVLFLYVYFSEEEAEAEIQHRRSSIGGPERTFRRARRAWYVLIMVCAFAFTVLLVSAIILHRFPWIAQNWADTLGIAVALFACVQWVPQVWTTWHLGHMGSLSVISIALSAPYTWIFGINMILRVGFEGWSVWIVYILVGTMQLILIITAVLFKLQGRTEIEKAMPEVETPELPPTGLPPTTLPPPSLPPSFSEWTGLSHARNTTPSVASDERRPLLSGSRRSDDRPLHSESRSPGTR